MANPIKRGQAGGQVSDFGSSQSAAAFVSLITPYGLKLQQVITSTGSVTIPADINFVYAICVGGGGSGIFNAYGGGAGGITWGWTIADNSCIIGAGGPAGFGTAGGYTKYGHLMAGGGGGNDGGFLGGASGFGRTPSTNYWGVQYYGGSTGSSTSTITQPTSGSNGVSGGGGGYIGASGTGRVRSGSGGSGLAGGGGSGIYTSINSSIGGGNGGNGFNIQTGQITLGGVGGMLGSQGSGGGGGGTAGDGSSPGSGTTGGNGGLGGGGGGGGINSGGAGGNGILYLYY